MKDFQKLENDFMDAMDVIARVAKGGTFTGERFDAAKTYANAFAKVNQTERAKEATQLMAISMGSKDEKEKRELVIKSGIIANPKRLKS